MQQKLLSRLLYFTDYIRSLFSGLARLYLSLFRIFLEKIKIFNRIEILFYFFLALMFTMTIPGWLSYEIVFNNEIIRHSISTDDFIIYLTGFILMSLPGILKIINININEIYIKIFFVSGIGLNLFFYFLSMFLTERIAPVSDANFTIWFYLYGFMLIVLLILGVLGFFSKPSTHLKNSWH